MPTRAPSPQAVAVPGATAVAASSGGPTPNIPIPVPARDVMPGTSWAFRGHRTQAEVIDDETATAGRASRTVALATALALPFGAVDTPLMTTVHFVRVFVFRMSQTEFAALLGTSQGRVSTWETSGRWPSVVVMDLVRLHGRSLCAARGEVWSDSWFFEVPDDYGALQALAAE